MTGRMNGRSVWVVGACALLVVGAMVVAGPITPPSGAIAPTGKTLQEIFDKPSDGRIAIPGGTSAVTISQPGSYVLTGNIAITTSGNGILIDASGVTLDLNGFTVSATTFAGTGITVNSGRERPVIRNGTIVGFVTAISVSAGATDALIENVQGKGARFNGFTLAGARCHVRRCDAILPGAGTSASDTLNGQQIIGFAVSGSGTVIEDCAVRDFDYNGTGSAFFRGVNISGSATGVVVRGCVISSATAITGTGVLYAGTATGVCRDNTIFNLSVGVSGGTNGGGNVP